MLYYKNLALESTNFSGQYEMSQNSWFYLIENRFCPQKFIVWQEQNQNKANKHTPYRNALPETNKQFCGVVNHEITGKKIVSN